VTSAYTVNHAWKFGNAEVPYLQIMKSESFHVQAYNYIKKLILEGGFQPGEQLKESRLAEQFGISRGPIREAVRILVQEGLLVQKDGRLMVFDPSFQDLVELYQCREYMESLAAKLAAEQITETELEELASILSKTKEAIAADNRKLISRWNTEFHDKIILASRNKELIRVLSTIRPKVSFIRNNGHQAYFREDNFIEEHERIYQRIHARDEMNAEKEMKRHIQIDIEKYRAFFEKRNSAALQ
jgi:DNA-binding GntR family transcriptional regulator